MQRKPIANKYRKGTMKSTLHSTCATQLIASAVYATSVQAPKGVKERVKSPYRLISNIILTLYVNILFLFSEVQSDRAPLHLSKMVAGYSASCRAVCLAISIRIEAQLSDPS